MIVKKYMVMYDALYDKLANEASSVLKKKIAIFPKVIKEIIYSRNVLAETVIIKVLTRYTLTASMINYQSVKRSS